MELNKESLGKMYDEAINETEKVLLKDRAQFVQDIKRYVQNLKGQDLMMYVEDYKGCTWESGQIKYHLASEEQDRRELNAKRNNESVRTK